MSFEEEKANLIDGGDSAAKEYQRLYLVVWTLGKGRHGKLWRADPAMAGTGGLVHHEDAH